MMKRIRLIRLASFRDGVNRRHFRTMKLSIVKTLKANRYHINKNSALNRVATLFIWCFSRRSVETPELVPQNSSFASVSFQRYFSDNFTEKLDPVVEVIRELTTLQANNHRAVILRSVRDSNGIAIAAATTAAPASAQKCRTVSDLCGVDETTFTHRGEQQAGSSFSIKQEMSLR